MTEEVSAMAGDVIVFLLGFLSAIFADPIRQWVFRARLDVGFSNDDLHIAKTEEAEPSAEGIWIRVRIANRSRRIAKNCRVYLCNVEKEDASGRWSNTRYGESLQLSWASHGDAAYEPMDLPQGVPMFVDVVSVRDTENSFRLATRQKPFRLKTLCSTVGIYRLTVIAVAENAAPKRIRLIFSWQGQWDQLAVSSTS